MTPFEAMTGCETSISIGCYSQESAPYDGASEDASEASGGGTESGIRQQSAGKRATTRAREPGMQTARFRGGRLGVGVGRGVEAGQGEREEDRQQSRRGTERETGSEMVSTTLRIGGERDHKGKEWEADARFCIPWRRSEKMERYLRDNYVLEDDEGAAVR